MRPPRLDPGTADRLLSGAVRPDDAPPGYAGVTRLLGRAADVDRTTVASHERDAVDAMSAVIGAHLGSRSAKTRGTPVLSKMLSLKTAVVASAVVLSAGTAAAATGSLPAPAQTTASHVLRHVGISIPGSDERAEHDVTRPAGSHKDASDAVSDHNANTTTPDEDATEAKTDHDDATDDATGTDDHENEGKSVSSESDDAEDQATAPASGAAGPASDEGSNSDHPEGPPFTPPGPPPASPPGSDDFHGQTPGEGNGVSSGSGAGAGGPQDESGVHGSGGPGHNTPD